MRHHLVSWFYDELVFYFYIAIGGIVVFALFQGGGEGGSKGGVFVIVASWLLGLLIITKTPKIISLIASGR